MEISFKLEALSLEEMLISVGAFIAKHKIWAESPQATQLTEEQWRDSCVAALFQTDPLDDRAKLITTKGQRV